jgi:hypothetical protein
MKFSEMDEASWPDLQPYFDTCLLPVTGITGTEAPWEMAERAAAAGDWLLPLEKAFKGRTVTLPACHYGAEGDRGTELLAELCRRCRASGFRYVILVSGMPGLIRDDAGADLVFQPSEAGEKPDPDELFQAVTALWRRL